MSEKRRRRVLHELGSEREREREGLREEQEGEDCSWNDREEDRVIEGVAGERGEACATRTTGGHCAEVSRSRTGLERVRRARGRRNERGNEQDGRNRSPVFRHGPDNVRYGRPLSRLVNRSIYVCICVFSSLRQPSPRDTLRGDGLRRLGERITVPVSHEL